MISVTIQFFVTKTMSLKRFGQNLILCETQRLTQRTSSRTLKSKNCTFVLQINAKLPENGNTKYSLYHIR